MLDSIVTEPIAFTVACATSIALVTIAVFSKQGGIQRLDLKIDRNGGQFTIEARDDLPPKLPEASEERTTSEDDRIPGKSID